MRSRRIRRRFSRSQTIRLRGRRRLLLLPFASMLRRAAARAAGTKRATRLMLFCTMGTKPRPLDADGVSGESTFTFSRQPSPLAAHKDEIVLVEGLPSRNPRRRPRFAHGITAWARTPAASLRSEVFSRRRSVRRRRTARGRRDRPIPSLLLGSNTSATPADDVLPRGNNLLPIASPTSAYSTVFGARDAASGPSPESLLKPAQEHPRQPGAARSATSQGRAAPREGAPGPAPRFDPLAGEHAHRSPAPAAPAIS